VLALGGGRVQAFGARDEVLRAVLANPPQIHPPLKVAAEASGSAR
jgi:ABC-type protease/lipase transport system fused ATPase/permease subunit